MVLPRKILIVDDDESLLNMLSVFLKGEGYEVSVAEDGEKALKALEKGRYKFALCDVRMPRMDGIELLKKVGEKGIKVPIIMMSAYDAVDNAVKAVRLGAWDYIKKPFQLEEILVRLKIVEERIGLRNENIALTEKIRGEYSFGNIVGKSKAMTRIFETIKKVADYKSTILIIGESGTGKDLIARAIHFSSNRSNKPFVPINCAAIPETLLESELFGYLKGSFTGAVADREGLFEAADQGTIFLDEIGEMPLHLQVKLLRVIQDGEVLRIGDTKPVSVDVRIIAATSRDLEKEIEKKRFREDLFYRLNVVQLKIPPLRERKEDIPHLVDFFVRKFNQRLEKNIRGVTPRAMKRLMDYEWKGNVRELENVLERVMIMSENDWIEETEISLILDNSSRDKVETGGKKESEVGKKGGGDVRSSGTGEWGGLLGILEENLREGKMSIPLLERELERQVIQAALQKTRWNRSQAAEILGISRRTLFYKMREYGFEERESGKEEK